MKPMNLQQTINYLTPLLWEETPRLYFRCYFPDKHFIVFMNTKEIRCYGLGGSLVWVLSAEEYAARYTKRYSEEYISLEEVTFKRIAITEKGLLIVDISNYQDLWVRISVDKCCVLKQKINHFKDIQRNFIDTLDFKLEDVLDFINSTWGNGDEKWEEAS